MSIKNIFLTGLLAASTAVSTSAQSQEVADSTAQSLEVALSDDYYVHQDISMYHNDLPSPQNPRKDSMIDRINKGETRGYYKDANGKYILFQPNRRRGGFTIKRYDDAEYLVNTYYVTDSFKVHPKAASSSIAETELIIDYLSSVPLVTPIVIPVD